MNDSPRKRALAWLPVRSLGARHRRRLVAHLKALPARDRYLRFGYEASDEQIERYVEAIDFEHDEAFGVFNRRLELVATAHLAFGPRGPTSDEASTAEFGVSVLPKWRGRGFGARLFDQALLRARNRGFDKLVIHALSENTAMLAIARKAAATVEREASETQAWLKLPQDTIVSHLDAALERAAAEIDFRLKSQARRHDNWLTSFDEVSAHISRSARHPIE
jgi:RimJ/RimL family protein N-acetyltransferase